MNDFSFDRATKHVYSSSEIPPLTKTEETAIPQLNFDGLLQEGDMPNAKLPFVWKVFEMLEGVETSGDEHIISWVENGRAFKVHNLDAFLEKVIPKYFNQTKLKSFQRQLNFYGFTKINSGPNHGAYFHPNFLKSDKTSCLSIRPKSSKNKKLPRANPTENELKHKDGRWISAIECIASRNGDQLFEQNQHQSISDLVVPESINQFDLMDYQPLPLLQPQDEEMIVPDPIFSHQNEPRDGDEVTVFGGKSFHFVG